MATLVLVDKFGDVKKRFSTSHSMSDDFEILPGEILSWRGTFFGQTLISPVTEITLGQAKAHMRWGGANLVPHFEVAVESKNSKDLFALISVCVKKFGGETIAINPQPMEHSLIFGIRDDFRRLSSVISQKIKRFQAKLSY